MGEREAGDMNETSSILVLGVTCVVDGHSKSGTVLDQNQKNTFHEKARP